MGLFGGNWDKPGLGVDKDAPKKKGIFLYFEIFGRKFWNLAHANIIYITASVLFIAFLYLIMPTPVTFMNKMISATMLDGVNMNTATIGAVLGAKCTEYGYIAGNLEVWMRSLFAVVVFTLFGCAPMAAGYSYITRCYTREQHAWVWSDFLDKVKENFKQSIVLLVVDIVILLLALNAVMFYYFSYTVTGNGMWLISCSIVAMLMFVYTSMHFYIYQIMVTFRCSIKELYKNALILAFAKLPMNVVLMVLIFAVNYLLFAFINTGIALLLSYLCFVSVLRFPVEFYAARVIQRQIIDGNKGYETKIDAKEAKR